MHVRTHATIWAATLPLLAALPAMAQQPNGLPPQASNPMVQAAASACRDDIRRYCANVMPGGGRIIRCLAESSDQLSAACKSSMLAAKSALGR